MNPEQRDGLRELSDWVASMRTDTSSTVSDLDRLIAGVGGGTSPVANASATATTGPVSTVDEVSATGAADGASDNGHTAEPGAGESAGTATATTSQAAPDTQADGDDGDGGDDDTDGEDDDDDERKKRSPGRVLFDWVVVIGVALFVAFVIRTFVLAHFVVDGTSMASTLHSGDRVFVNKLSYRLHDPNRGDVIVLHELDGTSPRDLIKRVIALEGETIEMRDCEVYIDGQLLEEPYLDPELVKPGQCGTQIQPTTVEDDHVFVMGDNRNGSQDSRVLGTIDEDEIVGRAFVVFWPSSNMQWL